MTVEKIAWGGCPDGEVDLYVLENGPMEVSVATFGGAVVSFRVPDGSGRVGEIALGYAGLDRYLADNCFFGVLVGRVANRIGKARFSLDGKEYVLGRNHGRHQLHGGAKGFSRRLWRAEAGEADGCPVLRLSLESADGDQGYPGTLRAEVAYTLTADALRLEYLAETDAPTPVNLTSHIYFNLDGIESGHAVPSCLEHEISLAASRVLEADEDLIPTGRLLDVAGSPLDFQEGGRLGRDVQPSLKQDHPLLAAACGFDHYYVLDRGGEELHQAATVTSARTGRRMEMFTTCPGFQLYSGNHIPPGLTGRKGETYGPRSGLCLEAQGFVDAPNRPEFPPVTLLPGNRYSQTTEYRFTALRPDG